MNTHFKFNLTKYRLLLLKFLKKTIIIILTYSFVKTI